MSEVKAISEGELKRLENVYERTNMSDCASFNGFKDLIESYREAISQVKALKNELQYVTWQLKEHGDVGPCTLADAENFLKKARDFLGVE